MKKILGLLIVTFVASFALSACAPTGTCPSGYSNPQWCDVATPGSDTK